MNVRRLLTVARPDVVAGQSRPPMGRRSPCGRSLMLIALAAVLAVVWLLAFFVLHVTFVAIHTLAFAAVVVVLVHFIRIHRMGRIRPRL